MRHKSGMTGLVGMMIVVVMAVVGCAGPVLSKGVDSGMNLEGTTWILQGGSAEITAEFKDGRVVGKAGCNRYFGSFTVTGAELALKGMGSTRMACAEPIMQAEQAFLQAMAAATGYSLSGNTLTISYDGGTLVFQAQ